MSDSKDLAKPLPKDIPELETQFQVEVIGKLTKKRFVGDFTCRIPNIKAQCSIDKHEAYLNGTNGYMLKPGTLKMHKMIAYLRFALVNEMPKWWKEADLGYELQDLNVIEEIYNKVLDFENKWIEAIWGEDPSSPLKQE